MTPYDSPYAARFASAYKVTTAHEIFAWTETNPITAGEWPADVYQNTGDPREDCFVLAVPTPAGLVAFFAESAEDAGRIRASVFQNPVVREAEASTTVESVASVPFARMGAVGVGVRGLV